jgi:CelD/BcsL family acetyltransferase involved in cellulose biosynthesis
MPIEITRLSEKEFDLIKEEWNELLGRSSSDSVFLRWEWIHTWWDVFKRNRTLLILILRRDGRLIGVAPFTIDREGLLQHRIVKLCSEELSPDYMDIVAETGRETEAAQAVMRYLRQSAGEWDVIALDNLRPQSPLLADTSLFEGFAFSSRISQHCPYINIEGTFEDYFRSRHRLTGFTLEKKYKKLTETQNVVHRSIQDKASFEKSLEDLFAMHGKRMESKQMQSHFIAPDSQRFHRQLGAYFVENKILNFQCLYAGGVAVGAFYGFNYRNKVYVYQNSFNPDWARWSVGAVLWMLGLQRAFQEGYKEFDFLKGTERYKSLWTDAMHEEMLLIVYNKSFRGQILRGVRWLIAVLRKIKHWPDRWIRPASPSDRRRTPEPANS